MNNVEGFSEHLLANCEVVAPPFSAAEVFVGDFRLPLDFLRILRITNGLISKGRLFRIFGTEEHKHIPSLVQWNEAEWKQQFGSLAKDLLFVAEDIFGDQYGFDRSSGDGLKFFCEGGRVDKLADGMMQLARGLIDPHAAGLLDWSLVEAAFAAGLKPQPDEHLAFRVPLIVRGRYEIDNLSIESVALHLSTLAQISVQNASLPEATKIKRFL